jgi:phospholipase A1
MLLLPFSIKLLASDKIEMVKEGMVDSLDINGESKHTIARIVNSSFNLRAYKENYFLPASYRYGSDITPFESHETKNIETEFQVSIRYDFASDLLGLGELYSFGYTQRSWWQLYSESAFFRESNYEPELFVKVPTYSFLDNSPLKGFKMGLIHQSNGRGGEDERSWNRVSLSSFLQTKNLITELELWHRLPDNIDYNPDLIDYLGNGKLKFMLPYGDHLFKLNLRSNNRTHKSSAEFIYTYPLPAREESDLFLYIKSFNGYGESLIDYNQNINKISIGVSISR